MEETDGVKIMHDRVYRLPELARFIVDGYCPETHKIYKFFGCFYYGHTCQPYRDVSTLRGDTVAERYG